MFISVSNVAAVAAGVASHLFFFKTAERHLYPLRYLQAYVLTFIVAVVARSHYGEIPTRVALSEITSLFTFYFAGLYSSLITYRLFFNPLNKIPGPFSTRISKLAYSFIVIKFDSQHQLQRLHKKYGKIVRIGPNDISVIDPDGVQVVSGPQSTCTKSPWYSGDTPLISMHTTRDRQTHDRRRRIWAPAFSDKSLRGYESRIQQYNDLLINKLTENSGEPINATKWFNLYSFDVMGDLGFGKSFDMLQSGQLHWAIQLLSAGMDPLGLNFPTWLFRAIIAIPGAATEYHRFISFCSKALDDRMKVQGKGNRDPDITHTLIDHFNKTDAEAQRVGLPMLQGDSRLIIVAGSDTTAATLVHLFYHLASQQNVVEKLRAELSSYVGRDGKISHQKIQDAEYLNGCINEALRLNPPVPSGVFRKTPLEGITIGKTFIPGNTIVQMPTYVMGHDEDSYQSAEKFIPERWSTKPEMIKHKDAFIPFSTGPFGCIGKNLAYLEIRLLTAEIIMKFDVRPAPGETGHKLLNETTDHFTLGLAELQLIFTKRS